MRQKTTRSEVVQVRLTPELKAGAVKAAELTSRTLSGYIQHCVQRTLADTAIRSKLNENHK